MAGRAAARTSTRASRRADERGVVVPSRLMIVAIVVLAIAGVMYVATSPDDRDAAAASGAPCTSSTTDGSATPSATPRKPLGTISPTATPTPTPSATTSAQARPSKKPAPRVKRSATYVQVFNNSGRTGLAGSTARKAEDVGWKVVGADNWYGTVPASTVYYPDGMKPAAVVLARDLGISRLKQRVAPMRNDGLTVILTADYQA